MNSRNCPTPSVATHRPQVLSREDGNGVKLDIALPGVSKEDLKLTFHESNLRVEADRNTGLPENWKIRRDTGNAVRYGLNVRLTARLDGARTTASFENGVLTLQVPVREDSKPRQIQVA